MNHPKGGENAGVYARQSPFYGWLDNAAIRDLVHRGLELAVGERLVLIRRLIPGLVQTMGSVEFHAILFRIFGSGMCLSAD